MTGIGEAGLAIGEQAEWRTNVLAQADAGLFGIAPLKLTTGGKDAAVELGISSAVLT